ncbi:hypothetical protein V8C44DRAFT_283368 [Trichoderma aethiopicum]
MMGRISELKGAARLFDTLLFLSALLLFHCISALDVFPVNRLFRLTLVSTCLFLTKSERQAESERQAQIAGRCHRMGVTKGAAKWKFCRAMGARDFVYPRDETNRCRSGFACLRWSGESAWVAFEVSCRK